eukprot:Sspe_Gene.117357::Locus_108480_Transcript_2_2_Confidence_0.500_Length_568::g.117357::m.117357
MASVRTAAPLKQQLLRYTRYHRWSTLQVEKWCKEHLGDEVENYTRDTGIPFRSIYSTLCHIWAGDQVWYARMHGRKSVAVPGRGEVSLDSLAQYWRPGEAQGRFESIFGEAKEYHDVCRVFDALLQSADSWGAVVEAAGCDDDLTEVFSYMTTTGGAYQDTKDTIITHVVNH